MRKCRNWQTSKTKDLVAAMSCGFKSHLPQVSVLPVSMLFMRVTGFFYLIHKTPKSSHFFAENERI